MKTILLTFAVSAMLCAQAQRWTEQKANAWYAQQPWLVGSNYTPANAINQLEFWQAETFDAARIDRELAAAAGMGMNTMRVYLHDLLWQQDAPGFRKRIDTFLNIANKHGIRPMFVLFDSCWDPFPQLGKQRAPKPGVHNSGWVQSPGAKALGDASQHPRLEAYVKGVVGAFANDRRVLAWDIWNEPDNNNTPAYVAVEPKNKLQMVEALLAKAFAWARAAKPTQPLTSAVWQGDDWATRAKLTPTMLIQIDQSDVTSFHDYNDPAKFESRVNQLKIYKRPILCTEFLARGNKSTFEGSLPVALKHGVAMYNWGFVQGKTQTHLPWDSWKQPYIGGREPSIWFHEVLRNDLTPYRKEEVELIKKLTTETNARKKAA